MKHYRTAKLIVACLTFIALGLVINFEGDFHYRSMSTLAAVVLSFLALIHQLLKKDANQCPHCGKIGISDGAYCPHCGQPLDAESKPEPMKKAKENTKRAPKSNDPTPPWEGKT